MFGLWYIILGWKEYNKPFRIPAGAASVISPAGQPDLIPPKKTTLDPILVPSGPPKPAPLEPSKTPDVPKPKTPEPSRIPDLPKPKTPESPRISDLPKPKTTEPIRTFDLPQPTPESPKVGDFPKPKTPESPKVPVNIPTMPKTPESLLPDVPARKQPSPSREDLMIGGKSLGDGKSVNGSQPKDMSYAKMVEGPGNVPANNFHVMEAGFQGGVQKPKQYKEVVAENDDWNSSDSEE